MADSKEAEQAPKVTETVEDSNNSNGADIPKVEPKKEINPKVENLKTEKPKIEKSKVQKPKIEQPKIENPKVEKPKPEKKLSYYMRRKLAGNPISKKSKQPTVELVKEQDVEIETKTTTLVPKSNASTEKMLFYGGVAVGILAAGLGIYWLYQKFQKPKKPKLPELEVEEVPLTDEEIAAMADMNQMPAVEPELTPAEAEKLKKIQDAQKNFEG